MRLGVHVSIAGKIYEAIDRGHALGCDAIQIFSRNPRGWAVSPLPPEDAEEFRRRRAATGVGPVVVHIPYLINLATPDERLYRRSIEAYLEDLRRTDALGAEYFVTHLGNHVGSGEEKGVRRFTDALNEIASRARPRARILLETTSGGGSALGYRFGQIGEMIGLLKDRSAVGVCLDTAHIFAAGYDIRSKEGLEKTLDAFDTAIGLDLIHVVHFNDSKAAFASRTDRHEHIGKGEIGLEALGRVITHPRLQKAAFIMETPRQTDADDRMNLRGARNLCKRKGAAVKKTGRKKKAADART